MLLRPRRSLVPVAQEQGLQEQLAVGFRTAGTDDHGNDTGLKADLQVSGASRLLLFFTLWGSEADSLHALDHHRAALHECQIKSAQSSVFHTDFIYVRW